VDQDPGALLLQIVTKTSYLFPSKAQHKAFSLVTANLSWHTTPGNNGDIPCWFLACVEEHSFVLACKHKVHADYSTV